jgi:hypothetical protein
MRMPTRLLDELHGFFRLLFGWKPGYGRGRTQSENDDLKPSTEVTSGQPSKSSGSRPFEVQCYIGSEIAQMQDVERPPDSAELVGSVNLGGNDDRTYLLSTNKKGRPGGASGWTLWQMGDDYDTGRPFCCRVAFAYPYGDCAAAFVAEQLLIKAVEDERYFEGMQSNNLMIYDAGLLSAQDFRRIFATLFS